MKILIVSNLYPPHLIGGYEMGCRDVVEELASRGHDMKVLTSRYGVGKSVNEGKVLRQLRELFSKRSWYAPLLLPFWEKQNQASFRKVADAFQPDIVYFWNMAQVSVSAIAQATTRGLPAAWYLSDSMITSVPGKDLWLRCLKLEGRLEPRLLFIRIMRRIFGRPGWSPAWPPAVLPELHCTSAFIAGKVGTTGLKSEGLQIIPWGVSRTFLEQLDARPSTRGTRGRITFLFSGRLVADKGALTALRAFLKLRTWLPDAAMVFKIVGTGEDRYTEMLQAEIRAADALDVVQLTGWLDREQLIEHYLGSDIYIFPSEWDEPFAISPLEAMAGGCALIATTTGGSAELFRDGENSLTYEAGNAPALSECMRRIVENAPLRLELAEAGRRLVREKYKMDAMIDKIENRLATLLESTRRKGNRPGEPEGGPPTTPPERQKAVSYQ
jgi:glycogen(starch) synthase